MTHAPSADTVATEDPGEVARRLAVAERLLASYQQALGHDLPNRLVAIQGLLQLTQIEAGAQLPATIRDYLNRLAASAQRMSADIRALAELGRAYRERQPVESLSLKDVAEEVAAEVNQLFPGKIIRYSYPCHRVTWRATRSALRRVLFVLFQRMITRPGAANAVTIEIGGREFDGQAELWIGDNGLPPTAEHCEQVKSLLEGQAHALPAGDTQMLLVRLILDQWGAEMELGRDPKGGHRLIIRRPLSSASQSFCREPPLLAK